MKTFILTIFLFTTSAFAQSPSSSYQMEDLTLEGQLPRKSFSEKLIEKRQKLERRNMKKLMTMMEYVRVQNELRLMKQTENAMQTMFNNIEIQ